ncbi:MAG: hypothetical protein FWG73_01635 [Planctomycetaceae bacterium]|nr:hypothetical protein [Planctomycetaceae bacterium]
MNRLFCTLCLIVLVVGLAGSTGCNRQFYRTKADHEVYSVLKQGNNDPRWKVDDYRITPDAASRMFDPFHPDKEPMPTDDPAAHRKMRSVGGMRGSKDWYEHGRTQHVENPNWRHYLLVNEKGEIPLDKEKAVELARLHATEYQSALESLYLAAMNVSQERFRYDVQFFGGDSLLYRVPGSGPPSLRNDATLRAERMLATGGNWAVELANSITWTLNGQGTWRTNSSIINVSVMQPLLRGANRKVVLERLTQTERDFLAELRRLILFQQGHYTRIVTGTVPRNTGVSGGGGFYRLLADQIQIQNRRQNVIATEENLNRFNELFIAGQLTDISQIAETRQSLLTSQSQLLEQINRYQSSVESYVSSLGLPPDLKVNIHDPLLEQFQLTSPTLLALQEDVVEYLAEIRPSDSPLPANFRENTKNVIRRAEGEIAVLEHDLELLERSIPERLANLRDLESVLAEYIASGERIDRSIYDAAVFEERVSALRTKDIPRTRARLQAIFTLLNLTADTEEQELREMIRNHSFEPSVQAALELLTFTEFLTPTPDPTTLAQQAELAQTEEQIQALRDMLGIDASEQPILEARRIIEELRRRDRYRDWVRRVYSAFQYELVSLSLMQTRTRLDAMTLVPVSITPDEAFQVASEYRLDWMNRKSQLVDAWRQIDITADRLKGTFNLNFNGGIGAMDSNRGVRFDSDTGNLDVRFEWESPLTRYNEMMAYRRSQIDYQRARRDYYTYIDSVHSDLRNVVRDVQMSQINFEINRGAVFTATTRVDVMQLRMEQPPARGARIDTSLSDQLIRALDGLMRSQNDLLNTWVAYQTQRMLLDLYMGTMSLDAQGRWIDPGVIGSQAVASLFDSYDFEPLDVVIPSLPMPDNVRILEPISELPRLNRRYID